MGIISKFLKELQTVSTAADFRLDDNSEQIYVTWGGYHFSIEIEGNAYYYMYASVRQSGRIPDKDIWKELKKETKGVFMAAEKENRVMIQIKGGLTVKATAQNALDALQTVTEFFRARGLTDSCENCGAQEDIGFYGIDGKIRHLCPECFAKANVSPISGPEVRNEKENVLGGILGAVLGSLLGVAVIILLAQIGYVAAIAGVIMGVGVLMGYEKLGKKLSFRGILFCGVIMIIMVYLAGKASWAIALLRELKAEGIDSLGFGDCWKLIPDLLIEIDSYGEYIKDMVLLYLFTALGAVPMIGGAIKDQKKNHTPYRLG